jgi:hypothetical protein
MPHDIILSVIGLLALLQVKHAICDGPLQTAYMVSQKGFYGKPGGFAHAGIHGLGSLAAFLIFGMAVLPALGLALTDAVIHYHVDFTKERWVRQTGWKTDRPYFWWALQADQLAHHLTYLGLTYLVITRFAP